MYLTSFLFPRLFPPPFFLFYVLRNAAIKDMASNVERRWRQMISIPVEGGSKAPDGKTTEGESRPSVLLENNKN